GVSKGSRPKAQSAARLLLARCGCGTVGRVVTAALLEVWEGAVEHNDAPQATIRAVLHDIETVRNGVAVGINGVPRVAGHSFELVETARPDDSATRNGLLEFRHQSF